jgi:hypothetical protein
MAASSSNCGGIWISTGVLCSQCPATVRVARRWAVKVWPSCCTHRCTAAIGRDKGKLRWVVDAVCDAGGVGNVCSHAAALARSVAGSAMAAMRARCCRSLSRWHDHAVWLKAIKQTADRTDKVWRMQSFRAKQAGGLLHLLVPSLRRWLACYKFYYKCFHALAQCGCALAAMN